ncbi:MAG: zinc-binding alcohol dehydrogenase [bacterium]
MKYKKVMFVAPGKVEIQEDEINPEDLPADHVLIKTHYSLISAGTELACLSGTESWFKMPLTSGYASVGEVVAKGNEVTNLDIGDTVFQYGHHEEYSIQPMRKIVVKVPETIDEKLIPFTRMATIAMTAIRVSDIELGDYVVVTGQGLIGNMAAQLAKLQGADVIVIDLSDKRLELSKKCGIEFCINSKQSNVREKIMKITDAKGISTLIEATGIPQVAVKGLPLIAKGGEIILLGSPRGGFQGDITDLFNYCHLSDRGYITFKGAHEWRFPIRYDNFVKHSIERNTKIVFNLMEKKQLSVKPLLSHVVKPYEIAKAYEGLKNNKDDYIGVIIDWN